MANANDATLRAAREKRLANTGTQSQAKPAPSATVASTGRPAKTPAPAPAAKPAEVTPPPAELTAKVVDPSNLPRTAEVSMHLFGAQSNDPHWMICANGRPVAEVRLKDQDEAAKPRFAEVFTGDQYANGILEAAKQMPLTEILAGIKARPYIASIAGSEAHQALETQVKAASVEEMRKTRATLRDSMLSHLGLVVEAQSKNFIVENHIKDGLYGRMIKAGLESDTAIQIIEAAWQEKATEHHEHLFVEAMKFMDMSPEALNELKERILDMPHRTPVVASAPANAPAASKNVPLATFASASGTSAEAQSEKDRMRSVMGFSGRRLAHTMSPK